MSPLQRIRVCLLSIEGKQGQGLGWEWARASWVRGMGGGPRTYPGGVTKWKWKRMLVKKREERQQRWLAREKAVYQMRQRAEVLSAHPELEQPWEKLTVFPPLAVSATQQVSNLVCRFQKPALAEDLWTQRDGPRQETAPDAEEEDADRPSEGADRLYMEAFYGEPLRSPLQTQPYSSRWLKMDMATPKKKKNQPSPIGRSMQDYLDAFDTDPLGVAAEIDTCTSKHEEHNKDSIKACEDKQETPKGKGSPKKKVGKGGRKNQGR